MVASTCLYAVGLLQTYTLKIAENNHKAALTKISVVLPHLLIFIFFLQAFNNMLSLPIMSTSIACDVGNSFLYADYVGNVQQLTCFVSWYVHSGGSNILAHDKCGDKCTEERQCQSEIAGICTVACAQTYVVNISVKQ